MQRITRLAGLTVADCGFGATRGKFLLKRAIAKLINAALLFVGVAIDFDGRV